MTTRGVAGVRERLERSLERWQEPGATELCEGVAELLGDAARAGERLHIARLKPAVVRHTGPSRLPDAAGLFRFRSMDEAVRALAAIESDYEKHCRLARNLAEEHFDGCQVVTRVLERAIT